MPSAWEDEEPNDARWSDPDAWRGDQHLPTDEGWTPDPGTLWTSATDQVLEFEEELLSDEEDWCPGGWLEEWGDEGEIG